MANLLTFLAEKSRNKVTHGTTRHKGTNFSRIPGTSTLLRKAYGRRGMQ
jgi:hypothetical protein